MNRWGPARQRFTVARYEICDNCAARIAIPVPVVDSGTGLGTSPVSEYRYTYTGKIYCSRACEERDA